MTLQPARYSQEPIQVTLRQRRRACWFVVLILTVIGSIGLTGTAVAHTDLISSDPADGTTLAQAPSSITLTFNEPVQNFEPVVMVTGPDDQSYQVNPPVVDSTVVRSDVTALGPPGPYTVAYRVLSVDGHPVTGQLVFELAGPATVVTPAAVVPSTPPTAQLEATPRPTPYPTKSGIPVSERLSPAAGPGSTTTAAGTVSAAAAADSGSTRIPTWIWVVAGLVVIAALIGVQQRRDGTRR